MRPLFLPEGGRGLNALVTCPSHGVWQIFHQLVLYRRFPLQGQVLFQAKGRTTLAAPLLRVYCFPLGTCGLLR